MRRPERTIAACMVVLAGIIVALTIPQYWTDDEADHRLRLAVVVALGLMAAINITCTISSPWTTKGGYASAACYAAAIVALGWGEVTGSGLGLLAFAVLLAVSVGLAVWESYRSLADIRAEVAGLEAELRARRFVEGGDDDG